MDQNYDWGCWHSGPLYFKEWICSISAITNYITETWIYCLSSVDYEGRVDMILFSCFISVILYKFNLYKYEGRAYILAYIFKGVVMHDTAGRVINRLHFDRDWNGRRLSVGEVRGWRENCSRQSHRYLPKATAISRCTEQSESVHFYMFLLCSMYICACTLYTNTHDTQALMFTCVWNS